MVNSYQDTSMSNSGIKANVNTISTGTLDPQHIKPRRFKVNYEKTAAIKKHWVQNDAFLSNWMNAYTLTIPDGEDFNTRTIKARIVDIQSDCIFKSGEVA